MNFFDHRIYIYMYIYAYIYICIYMHMCVCTHVYTSPCVYIHINTQYQLYVVINTYTYAALRAARRCEGRAYPQKSLFLLTWPRLWELPPAEPRRFPDHGSTISPFEVERALEMLVSDRWAEG